MSRTRSVSSVSSRDPAASGAREAIPVAVAERMPIEELSRRTGVTVRNLRELQTRGLLEPPQLDGRKGVYTERHFARVVLVRNLQERGYSIAAIADLLDKWKGDLGPLGILHLEEGVATHGMPPPRRLEEDEIFDLVPELRSDAKLLSRSIAEELVCRGEDGRLYAPNAELLETARLLADAGIPLTVQVADFHLLRQEVDVMVRRFRTRFQEHVIARLQAEGMTAAALESLADRLARIRPAVARGVAQVLSEAMARGVPLSGGPPPEPSAEIAAKPEARARARRKR